MCANIIGEILNKTISKTSPLAVTIITSLQPEASPFNITVTLLPVAKLNFFVLIPIFFNSTNNFPGDSVVKLY